MTVTVSGLKLAIPEMRAGDRVFLSGDIYTARDAAHTKLFELLGSGQAPPFRIGGAVIYYAGPTPGGNRPVGSCGPTTSGRMDAFTPRLHDLGLIATIGKGQRSGAVRDAIMRNGAVYLCAVGGAGALITRHITAAEEIAFAALGCESIKRLTIDALPLTVGADMYGNSVYRGIHG
jgi:fumarate hydratase subunit beta